MPGIGDDIVFGGAIPAANQSDASGEEGQRLFPIDCEQTFGRKALFKAFDPGKQVSEADCANFAGAQHELATIRPELCFDPHHDAIALGQSGG